MFAYQAVYQRHLTKHRDNSEISEYELHPMIAESLRLADEIVLREQKSVCILEEEEPELEQAPTEENSQEIDNDPDIDGEEDKNTDLIAEEEAQIALKLQKVAKLAGRIKSFLKNYHRFKSIF